MTKQLNIYRSDGTLIASGVGNHNFPVKLLGLPKGSYSYGTFSGAWSDGTRVSKKFPLPSFNVK